MSACKLAAEHYKQTGSPADFFLTAEMNPTVSSLSLARENHILVTKELLVASCYHPSYVPLKPNSLFHMATMDYYYLSVNITKEGREGNNLTTNPLPPPWQTPKGCLTRGTGVSITTQRGSCTFI
jgi:hypothetical protein